MGHAPLRAASSSTSSTAARIMINAVEGLPSAVPGIVERALAGQGGR